eukprot:4513894-Lingulodinium_polyedra.AAC.1
MIRRPGMPALACQGVGPALSPTLVVRLGHGVAGPQTYRRNNRINNNHKNNKNRYASRRLLTHGV